MLKGISERGVHWHRKHMRDISKRKHRVKKYHLARLAQKNVAYTLDVAERKYRNALERQKKVIVSPIKRFLNKVKSVFKKQQHAI